MTHSCCCGPCAVEGDDDVVRGGPASAWQPGGEGEPSATMTPGKVEEGWAGWSWQACELGAAEGALTRPCEPGSEIPCFSGHAYINM